MKHALLSTLILFFAILSAAATPQTITEQINSVLPQNYPDASSVIISDKTEIVLEKDGSFSENSYSLVKILNDTSKKDYGTLVFPYNSRYQTITSLNIRVYYPDGTLRELPGDSITDSTMPAMQHMNIFEESFRQKSAIIGDFPVGSAIETTVITKTKPLLKNNYCETFYFQNSYPALFSQVKITAPSDMPLIYSVNNGTVDFIKTTEKGNVSYLWQAKNSPQIIPEPYMPSLADEALSLSVSTFQTWENASKFSYELNKDKYTPSPAIKAKITDLTKGLDSEEEKILAIYRFVSQKIRYMGSAMDVSAYIESHPASYTFEKGYGVCRDKATLMTCMMQTAGIKCKDALINPSRETNPSVPTVFFEHVICYIETKNGKHLALDPTMEFAADPEIGYAGERYMLPASLQGDPLVKLPPSPTERHAGKIETTAILNDDLSLDLSAEIKSCGDYETALRQLKSECQANVFKSFFEQILSLISPGAQLEKLEYGDPADLNLPFDIRLKTSAQSYAVKAGGYILMPLPSRRMPFDLLTSPQIKEWGSLQDRRYDINVSSPMECSIKESIKIPSGYKAISLPPAISVNGAVSANFQTFEKDGKIIFQGKISINSRRISKNAYQEIKNTAKILKNFERHMVILEKL